MNWIVAKQKKKIIKLANKTYPSDNTCAITEDGNVICWGDAIGSKTILVRPQHTIIENCNVEEINDWFADEISVGEHHVVILAKPILYSTCDEYNNKNIPVDPITKLPILDNSKTKLITKSFAKSTFEDTVSSYNTNIWFGSLGVSSPFEIKNSEGKFTFSTPSINTNTLYDGFIGIKRSDRNLFGVGYPLKYSSQYTSPLFPLPSGEFLDVSYTGLHAAGLRTDGKVIVWGNNLFRQTLVPSINKKIVRVVTGRYHTCALTEDNKVICWGAGMRDDVNGSWPHYGQSSVPDILNNKSVIQIECGYYFSAALTDTGEVYTWGSFRGVTLSQGTRSDFSENVYSAIRKNINRELVPKPTELETDKIKLIACSPYSIAALSRGNTLYGWGHDGEIGTTLDIGENLPIKGIPSAIQRFNKQLKLQGVNLSSVDVDSFAIDRDENVFLLMNIYGCAGTTFLENIFNERTTTVASGSASFPVPVSDGLTGIALFHYNTNIDLSNYKQFIDYDEDKSLWVSTVNSGCFNCRVMTETEFVKLQNLGFPNGFGKTSYSDFGGQPSYAMFITQGITGMQSPSEKPLCFKGTTFIADQIYETCKDPNRPGDSRPWCVSPRTWHSDPEYPEECIDPDPFADDCGTWLYGQNSRTDPGYPFEIKQDPNFPDFPIYEDIVLLQNGTYDIADGTEVLDQDGNVIKKPLSACSNLSGCRKGVDYYRSIIWKRNNSNCINCIIGDECDFFDLTKAYRFGGLTAQSFVGSTNCFYKQSQKYVWQTEDNKTQLFPIFNDLNGCIDLDADGNLANDEDDLLGCSTQILKEQILFKFNAQDFTKLTTTDIYPAIQTKIIEDNVFCSGRNSPEPLWTGKDFAYNRPYNICNRTTLDIVQNWYTPDYVKQEITNLLTAGNMAFYIMKPDIYFINDFTKLTNYKILTTTTARASNASINKMYSSNSGEILLINRNSSFFEKWSNSELFNISKDVYGTNVFPFSCDSYTLQPTRDPSFSPDFSCGVWPNIISTRRVLSASFGNKHGVYVVASPNCIHDRGITFDTTPDCVEGYISPIANGTGFTGLNGPVSNIEHRSSFWRAIEDKDAENGNAFLKIKHTSEPLNIDNFSRLVNRYAASAGYYHTCIITDESLTIGENTYNPGDVICWGVGADDSVNTVFSFGQAKGITYSNSNKAEQIRCGYFHTLVLENINGITGIKAYGAGTITQNNINAKKYDFGQSIIPNNIKLLEPYIKFIECGPFHNGIIYSILENEYNYIGWGYGTAEDAWIKLKSFSKKVVDFSMGEEHVVILFEDGSTECLCNDNNDGKCNISLDPVFNGKKYKHIHAKGNLTLAVDQYDNPYVFGNLKDNIENIPPELLNIENGRIIKKISAGKDHTLILKGYVDDALGVGEVVGYGNDITLSDAPTPPIEWLKTGSASNTTVGCINTPYKQLKIYGDGRNEPYINESVFKINLIGTTGISTKSLEWILQNEGTLDGITLTNYLQFIRREKLKDPNNTGYSCKDISAEGLRGVAIKTIPDVKWNRNDIGFNARIIPWGYEYKKQPRSLNLLFEQATLAIDTEDGSATKGEIFAIRNIPTQIETNVLGTAVKVEKYIIKVGDDNSLFEKVNELWLTYGDNSNDTLGTKITGVPELEGLNNLSATVNIINRQTGVAETRILTKFKQISCGRWHTIGIIDDPEIEPGVSSPLNHVPFVWGNTDIVENYDQIRIPLADDGSPLRFRYISAGNYHNVGILYKGEWDENRTINGSQYEDYEVYCWGAEVYGEDTDIIINYGQTVTPLDQQGKRIKALQVSAGLYHSLAIDLNGIPYGWGAGSERYQDSNERQANPHYSQSIIPVDDLGDKYQFKYISAGDYHSGGIRLDGTLLLWGDNRSSQCNEIYSKTNKFTKIDCANQYSIGLTDDGIVYGWGWGSAESRATLPFISPSQANPGYSILSAFPPRETMGLSNFNEDNASKIDKDTSNFVGENNLAITKDEEKFYLSELNADTYIDVLDTWGDNSFYPTNFFDEIFIPTNRAIYQNINYNLIKDYIFAMMKISIQNLETDLY